MASADSGGVAVDASLQGPSVTDNSRTTVTQSGGSFVQNFAPIVGPGGSTNTGLSVLLWPLVIVAALVLAFFGLRHHG